MDQTIAKYERLFSLPVVSLNIESIGALLAARAKHNLSALVGVYTPRVSVVLTIPAGSKTATFSIMTNYTASTLQDSVTAFYNGASSTAGVTVTP